MKRQAMAVFRRLPGPMRRAVVHAATPSFTAGAVAVLRRDDGRIAFVEQRHTPGWGLPGGLMERGESPEQCLLRELVEELGVVVDPASLPLPFAAVNAGVRRVDVVYFIDAPPGVRLRTEDEIEVSRTGWFSLDALPELNEPTVDILRAVRVL